MAACDICGESAGLFSSRHPDCEAERQVRMRAAVDAINNVLASLARGELPSVNLIDSPIIFGKNEKPLYAFGGVVSIVEKTERVWIGRSSGTSVRLAKGLSVRLGRSGGRSVSETVLKNDDVGWLFFTTKHVHFYGGRKGVKVPIESVSACQCNGSTLQLDAFNRRYRFCFVETHPHANGTAENALSLLNAALSVEGPLIPQPPTLPLPPANTAAVAAPSSPSTPHAPDDKPLMAGGTRTTFGRRGIAP